MRKIYTQKDIFSIGQGYIKDVGQSIKSIQEYRYDVYIYLCYLRQDTGYPQRSLYPKLELEYLAAAQSGESTIANIYTNQLFLLVSPVEQHLVQ